MISFFFFKQKTAYEMRISDWSSDVCSSDLDARAALIASADGDGRFLLNQVETLFAAAIDAPLDPAELAQFLHRRMPVYDKDRDGHYNLISALHKAMRGSDPQASLYWLARMLVAGEEPLYKSEEHTSELQSLMRISYGVFRLKKKN